MNPTEILKNDRPRLFSIAYRMLGSASDAEDVLQDAWLRLRDADLDGVRSPQAFATTIVTRLCLDRLKSARATREQYIGPWLPEPVLTGPEENPDVMLQRSESVTMAFLVLLERLSPEERAVFLLKEVFDYDHAQIAEMLELSVANSRQIFHRAKARLAEGRPRFHGDLESKRAVVARFVEAFSSGDAERLASVLREDVGMWSDGGGKATAARRPLLGRDDVLRFVLGLYRTAQTRGLAADVAFEIAEVNHEPAVLLSMRGVLESVFIFSVEDDRIAAIRVVRNPDKLAFIVRQHGAVH